jgi:hypothetical protein
MAVIDNCDGFNYWYRRVPTHPDRDIVAVATSFRDAVAEDLLLRAPFPTVVWYAPENWVTAKQEWLDACRQAPHLDWSPEQNPFLSPCEVFKFPKEEAQKVVHRGYTHRDGPCNIGILHGLSKSRMLAAVAHECFHVWQDDNQPGWRMDNMREADEQAEAYAKTIEDRFPQFFDAGSAGKPLPESD